MLLIETKECECVCVWSDGKCATHAIRIESDIDDDGVGFSFLVFRFSSKYSFIESTLYIIAIFWMDEWLKIVVAALGGGAILKRSLIFWSLRYTIHFQ